MPWVGQTFERTDGTRSGPTVWDQNRVAGVKIVSNGHDTHDQDMAGGITDCLRKSGGNAATANIPMGGFRFTNAGSAVARTDFARADDVQDGKLIYGTVGGTADAITVTLSPAATNYVDGFTISFRATATNTGAVTVDVNGLGAKPVEKMRQALVAADITANDSLYMIYDSGGGGGTGAFALITHQRTPVFTDRSVPASALDAVSIAVSPSGLVWSSNTVVNIAAKRFRAEDTEAVIDLTATSVDIATTGNGGRLDGDTRDPNTWYNVMAGLESGAAVVGLKKAYAKPTAWSEFRRIGSVETDGSSNIIGYTQDGDEFLRNVPIVDYNATNPGTLGILRAVSAPLGVKTRCIHTMHLLDTGISFDLAALITSPDQADTAVAAPGGLNDIAIPNPGGNVDVAGQVRVMVRTDTSSQIRTRLFSSDATVTIYGVTHGYMDRRGRDD